MRPDHEVRSTDTRSESKTGKNLEFWFEGFCQEMQVTTLEASQRDGCRAKGQDDLQSRYLKKCPLPAPSYVIM